MIRQFNVLSCTEDYNSIIEESFTPGSHVSLFLLMLQGIPWCFYKAAKCFPYNIAKVDCGEFRVIFHCI